MMLCYGPGGEAAAVKVALTEEEAALLENEWRAYEAMKTLQGDAIPETIAYTEVWLPTVPQFHVPCIVLQWLGRENGDNLSEEERCDAAVRQRILNLHKACGECRVVQTDPAWRNVGVVRKGGHIERFFLYDFGQCIIGASPEEVQRGLDCVDRALFGRSSDGSVETCD